MAGEQCPRTDTTLVRIPGVGDRRLCPDGIARLDAMGMAYRRLDQAVPLPLWRQRNLARDFTGRVLG
jgi:hypothetical protein